MDLGERLYRARGWIPVLPILGAIVFADPRPVPVAAGLALVAMGEGLRLWSASYLGGTVRASSPRTAKLVTRGPYAHTRHPIYWGNFALTTGFTLATGAGFPWFPAAAALGFLALYGAHARREERALAQALPEAHAAYTAAVPAWRWRLRPAKVPETGNTGSPSLGRGLGVELPSLHIELWILAALWLRTHWTEGG